MNTLTRDEVVAIHAYELTRGKSEAEIFKACVSKVYGLLVDRNPEPTADDAAARPPATSVRLAAIQGHAIAASPQRAVASAMGVPPSAQSAVVFDLVDDHHHAHVAEHQAALWEEARRAVVDAGIAEGDPS